MRRVRPSPARCVKSLRLERQTQGRRALQARQADFRSTRPIIPCQGIKDYANRLLAATGVTLPPLHIAPAGSSKVDARHAAHRLKTPRSRTPRSTRSRRPAARRASTEACTSRAPWRWAEAARASAPRASSTLRPHRRPSDKAQATSPFPTLDCRPPPERARAWLKNCLTTHLSPAPSSPGEREARPFELVEEPRKNVAVPDLLDEHHLGAQGGERFARGQSCDGRAA